MSYQIRYFNNRVKRNLSKLGDRDKKLIRKYIENNLISGLYKLHSKRLKANLRGFRSYKMEKKGNYRLIFIVCEECRQIGYNRELKCVDCEKLEDKTVKLILYDYRDKIYDKLERMLK